MVKNIARGTFAVVIVPVAFALVAWFCGAIILPHQLQDPVICWTVATAAAIAVDALVAMWAYSLVKGGENPDIGAAKAGADGQELDQESHHSGTRNSRSRYHQADWHGRGRHHERAGRRRSGDG